MQSLAETRRMIGKIKGMQAEQRMRLQLAEVAPLEEQQMIYAALAREDTHINYLIDRTMAVIDRLTLVHH